jgi:hypothetical protein
MSQRKKSASSSRRRARRQAPDSPTLEPGTSARAPGLTLQSYEVGALPILNYLLQRMQLEELLQQHLPADDPRCELPTSRALLVLVRNVLMSREPVYAIAEWTARFLPDQFDLGPQQLSLLHDDRLGRSLTRLFLGAGPELILAVVRHVIAEFDVSLDELHNDSPTVSF